jgi:site-specific recombinase XerD
MSAHQLLDAAGRPRSPATMPGHHAGRVPPNKGRRYPADPPTVDEIVAVMRQAGDRRHGWRMRGLIVVLWRAGVRIHDALSLAETDLNERRGSLLIRHGKGDRRREVGMDPWAWSVLADWTAERTAFPPGPLFCVIEGPTRGRAWSATAVRAELRHLATDAGVRRRFAPHQYADMRVMPMFGEKVLLSDATRGPWSA